MKSLEVTFKVFPGYLHAIGTGERTPGNITKFFEQAVAMCKQGRHAGLLFESRLTGRSVDDATLVFDAISAAIPDLAALRKLAYVPGPGQDPRSSSFAETVAINRGVDARVFETAEAAAEWVRS
jgi:hypothetical protein